MRHHETFTSGYRILVTLVLILPCTASFGDIEANPRVLAASAAHGAPAPDAGVPAGFRRDRADGLGPEPPVPGAAAGLTAEAREKIEARFREVSYRIERSAQGAGEESSAAPYEAAALNRAHNLRAVFRGGKSRFRPAGGPEGSWDWELSLAAYGYEGALAAVGAPELWADGNRLEYRRGDLTEWYINDARGLEHGFTLAAPPADDRRGTLVLQLRTDGPLTAAQEGSAASIVLRDADGRSVLRYSGLVAWDADGTELAAAMTAAPGRIEIRVDDRHARYPVTIDPLLSEIKKLGASDPASFDEFGKSVGISGDTAVVGAPFHNDLGSSSGAAFVFERNQGGADNWGLVKELLASDGAAGDWFGFSVAIAVDTIVVGAPEDDSGRGAAYVFGRNQGGADNWGLVKKLVASDGAPDDQFGFYKGVAIAVDTIVVGAHQKDVVGADSGAAYVFFRNQGGFDNWGFVKQLLPGDGAAEDRFGDSVATSGDRAVVGAPWDDDAGTRSGSAYVFNRNLGGTNNWAQEAKLTADDATSSEDYGTSVAVAGDRVVVGAKFGDTAAGNSGKAYVHERHQGGTNNWGVVRQLIANDAAGGDVFAEVLSLSGDTVVVGAWFDDDAGSASGSAYVFQRNQGGTDNWGQVKKLTASDASEGDELGISVSVSGGTVVVGASKFDGAGTRFGQAYVFGPGPPAAAIPIGPSGTSPDTTPTYIWRANAATWYYLWIDGPSGNLLRQWYTAASICSDGTCSVTPALPLGLGTHDWWVRTWDDQGQGPWSARTSFTVSSAPGTPGVPALIEPAGAIGVRTPSYVWHAVPADELPDGTAADAATWYQLWVNGPSGNLIQQWYTEAQVCSGLFCAITPSGALATGDHTWWVRGWNPQGNGAWSPAVAFTVPTSGGPPPRPILTAPSGSITDTTPTYTWERASGSTWYRLWVDGPGGTIIQQWYTAASVCVGDVCSATPSTVLGSGAHRWWVRSWNPDGNGPWSARGDFILP